MFHLRLLSVKLASITMMPVLISLFATTCVWVFIFESEQYGLGANHLLVLRDSYNFAFTSVIFSVVPFLILTDAMQSEKNRTVGKGFLAGICAFILLCGLHTFLFFPVCCGAMMCFPVLLLDVIIPVIPAMLTSLWQTAGAQYKVLPGIKSSHLPSPTVSVISADC